MTLRGRKLFLSSGELGHWDDNQLDQNQVIVAPPLDPQNSWLPFTTAAPTGSSWDSPPDDFLWPQKQTWPGAPRQVGSSRE